MKITERIKSAWNVFSGKTYEPPLIHPQTAIINYYKRQTRAKMYSNKARFVGPIFARIALDISMTTFNHVKVNKSNDDVKTIDSGLNYCLNVEANIDQSNVQFIFDVAYSLLDEGHVAIVPVETNRNINNTDSYDIGTLRVGRITGMTPEGVKVLLYNDFTGVEQEIWLKKRDVAIIESPLYSIINEPNSTLQRMLKKMSILDKNEDNFDSQRLDIFLQYPQTIRTDLQRARAEERLANIEHQMQNSPYGMAYIDGTEKVIQLNRPANNQIAENITKLREEFFNQLGLTKSIFDGTATEEQIRNYYTRSIDPIIEFIVKELERKFLSITARAQGHKIEAYRNMLKFTSAEQLSNLSDTLKRNEIATANEIRRLIGFKRSNEANADKLTNPNIATSNQQSGVAESQFTEEELDEIEKSLGE